MHPFRSNSPAAYLDRKYSLYQRAVQSPKGDISWMVKFFREYVGGRVGGVETTQAGCRVSS